MINALTGQDVALVSDVAGTTTDPVIKSMEIHGAVENKYTVVFSKSGTKMEIGQSDYISDSFGRAKTALSERQIL